MNTHKNSEILTAVLAHWLKPMMDAIVTNHIGKSDSVIAANEWVKKYFPVTGNYSIVNDLSFLVAPAIDVLLTPFVKNGIVKLGLDEEGIPAYASKLVDSLIAEAKAKGKVTLFNTIEFEENDFVKLRCLLEKNLPMTTTTEEYQVKE